MSMYDYEREQRLRIARTDWNKLHIRSDKRPAVHIASPRHRVHGVVSDERMAVGLRVSRGGFREERRP